MKTNFQCLMSQKDSTKEKSICYSTSNDTFLYHIIIFIFKIIIFLLLYCKPKKNIYYTNSPPSLIIDLNFS